MKFLQADDKFWREYARRLKELDDTMLAREADSRQKETRNVAR